MKRNLILISILAWLHLCLPLCAQFSQTIVASSVGIDVSGNMQWSNNGVTSINIPNIGQSVHTYAVTSVDKVPLSGLCTAWFIPQMNGSWDGANFVPLSALTITAFAVNGGLDAGSVRRVQQANGAYPFLILHIGGTIDTVNCTYTATYTGVLYSFAPNGTTLSFASASPNSGSRFRNTAAAGNTTLFNNGTHNFGVTVYGLTICNSTAAQTVKITDEAANVYLELENMIAGQCYSQPASNFPFFSTVSNQARNLVVNLANATAVDITWFQNIE